jgi:hypothetical protein
MKLYELKLPMDKTSRFKRAVSMGYTVKAFHGTGEDFKNFKIASGDLGIHFGTNDQAWDRLTQKYPWNSSPDYDDPHTQYDGRILPVLLKIRNPLELEDVGGWNDPKKVVNELSFSYPFRDASSTEDKYLIHDVVRKDKEISMKKVRKMIISAGFDAIKYENKYEGERFGNSYIVFLPSQIRSIFAKFNPNKSRSGNISEVMQVL